MRPGEEPDVLAPVMGTFDRFVRPDFSDAGVAEFARAAREFVLERPRGHEVTVAEQGGQLIGMIDLRDATHVSLLFVDADHQRRGVGASLLAAALGRHPEATVVTVNSGPAAVPAYLRLGFVPTAPEAEANGIRFVPMRKELSPRGSQADQPDSPTRGAPR